MRKVTLRPFGKTRTSLGAQLVADHESSDNLNVRMGDGRLVNRYGWQNLRAAQSGFSAGYHFGYFKGIDSTKATVEEIVTVETLSGTTKPYKRTASSGAPTVITKAAAAAATLHASTWRSVQWKGRVFLWNNNDTTYPLAEYTLGDIDSWRGLGSLTPPSTAIVLNAVKNTATHATDNYRSLPYTGVHVTNDIAFTGKASTAVIEADGSLTINHTTGFLGGGASSITVTLNGATGPGLQDFTYNDVFYFSVSNADSNPGNFAWNPSSLKASIINNDGSPETATLELVAWDGYGGAGGGTATFMFKYPPGYTRTLKDNSRKIKFEYVVTQTGGTAVTDNPLVFSPIEIGCIHPEHWGWRWANVKLRATYYWKDSTTGDVTGFAIPVANHVSSQFDGLKKLIGGQLFPMGIAPRFQGTNGGSTDKWVLVFAREDDNEAEGPIYPLRIVAEYSDADLNQYYTDTFATHMGRSKYEDIDQSAGLIESEILCAVPHMGHMVWGTKGGSSNIQHSAIGAPLTVFREDEVDFGDATGPANFTLSANESENPVQMHSVGRVLFVLSDSAVYAQVGEAPKEMSYFQRVGSLPGTAGFNSSCVFKSDNGHEGVAYLSNDLKTVYFISSMPIEAGVYSFPPVELSADIRGTLTSKLFGSSPTLEDVYVRYDAIQDALWVTYHDKAAVLRKPSLVDGERFWEFYDYTITGNPVQWDLSQDYGIRAFRSTGEIDDFEYDSADLSVIDGALRDGGSAVTGYWESKEFVVNNQRVRHALVDREDLTDTPTVTITSSRATNAKTCESGKRRIKYPITAQGTEHKVKVTLSDNSDPINYISLEVVPAGNRTNE